MDEAAHSVPWLQLLEAVAEPGGLFSTTDAWERFTYRLRATQQGGLRARLLPHPTALWRFPTRQRQEPAPHSPNALQNLLVERVYGQVVAGDGDEQGLAEQHRAGGVASTLFAVALPEVHRQVHLLTVLFLHLIPTSERP